MNTLAHAPCAAPEQASCALAGAPVLRLLLITDTAVLDTGGSERFLRNLLGGLAPERYGIDVVQLAPAPARGVPSPALLRRTGVRLEHRPIGAIYGIGGWRVYRELRRRMLRGDYDIVQSQHEKADLLCALLPRGPTAAIRISNRRDSGFQKSPRLRAAFRAINHRFDWVVAPSQALLTQLSADEGVAAQRTRCLPNGVDSERFQPIDPALRPRARLAFGLHPTAFLFGCVARLVAVKRHQDVIAAFAQVAQQDADCELILIGGGELESALRQQVAGTGLKHRVRFLGERADTDALLPLLDASLLCSQTEGMANAILEAMACALPVIATAVGGSPEMIENEVTGLLVPPGAPEQIAAAMLRLLRDAPARRELGRQARLRVEQRYSIGAMADGFDRLYRTAFQRQAAP